MNFTFPYIGNVIIPIDELIFFRGAQPPTRYLQTFAWNLQDWSECSMSCGIGNRSRTREIDAEVNGGTPCDPAVPTKQSEECRLPCPRDCVWGDWGVWTSLGLEDWRIGWRFKWRFTHCMEIIEVIICICDHSSDHGGLDLIHLDWMKIQIGDHWSDHYVITQVIMADWTWFSDWHDLILLWRLKKTRAARAFAFGRQVHPGSSLQPNKTSSCFMRFPFLGTCKLCIYDLIVCVLMRNLKQQWVSPQACSNLETHTHTQRLHIHT